LDGEGESGCLWEAAEEVGGLLVGTGGLGGEAVADGREGRSVGEEEG